MGIFALITTLLPSLLSLLGTTKVLPVSITDLIAKLLAAVEPLGTALLTGGTVESKVLAALQAVQAGIEAVKDATGILSQNDANLLVALDAAIADAIKSYNLSLVLDDPSTLTPLPESFPTTE